MKQCIIAYVIISITFACMSFVAFIDDLDSPSSVIGKACAMLLFWPIFLAKLIYVNAVKLWRNDDV